MWHNARFFNNVKQTFNRMPIWSGTAVFEIIHLAFTVKLTVTKTALLATSY
jgi:hypothetical protein